MEHSFEELRHKTVAQLREIAQEIEHEAVEGYTQMHKADLVQAVCRALGIEAHEHHEVVGVDKAAVKAQIRGLKAERDVALEAHDHARLKLLRRRIHRLKRRLHKATV
jgi:uncharacterized protein (DUF342 family)